MVIKSSAPAPTNIESVISHRVTKDRVVIAAISEVIDLVSSHVRESKEDDYGILNAEYLGNEIPPAR